MDLIHADLLPWGGSLVPHRQGTIAHKRLFEGCAGSPDNFSLTLAREQPDYFSPRHRHNWDQVRFCLRGSVPVGKALTLDAGEVGYFPEGVRYGPQEGGIEREVLVLQFGGASGQGYMTPDQTLAGREALLLQGVFEGGVFKRPPGTGKQNQDAYEAIWQQIFGQAMNYPKGLY